MCGDGGLCFKGAENKKKKDKIKKKSKRIRLKTLKTKAGVQVGMVHKCVKR